MTHVLKTWPEYFRQVRSGVKKFEIRLNDRNFQVGDTLLLEEYLPEECVYTGARVFGRVTCIVSGFGLREGYVVLGISLMRHIR